MNCSICGAQIPMGQPNCPNCGAMVQQAQPMQPMGGYQQPMEQAQPMQPMGGYQQPMGQPMQPMGGYQQPMGQPMQPMGGYQQPMGQPMQPMGGYQQPAMKPAGMNAGSIVGALTGDIMKLVGLIGAFIILISPFISWLTLESYGEKESGNFFEIADLDGFGINCEIFTFLAILLMLVGAALIVWDLADYAPAFAKAKSYVANIPYFELILCGVALIVMIIALAHGDLNDCMDLVEDWGGEASRSAGPIIGFLGVIAATAPRVMNMLGIKIGK